MISALRGYFAPRDDPYAGGDLDNAQRIGFVLFSLQAVLMAALWPVSPPTQPIGSYGWGIAAAIAGLGLLVADRMRRRELGSWSGLLLISYLGVVAIEILQWLGGGIDAPYERAIFLPAFFVAAIQPPRRIACFLGFVALALALPLIYDGWHPEAAGSYAATVVILAGLSLGVNIPMSAIRAQRLAHVREEAEAREEARQDSLTGLHNRRAFDEELTEQVRLASRLDLPLSVAMVDIVDFKRINDRWSLAHGDRCLRAVGQALRATVRDPDRCYRWGGDEFALILTGTAASDTEALASRISDAVRDACQAPDAQPLQIRFAVAELRDGVSPTELTELAALALTATKLDAAR